MTGVIPGVRLYGNEVWSRDIQRLRPLRSQLGLRVVTVAPGGALFIQVLHGMKTDDPSYILRIDAATGKTTWRVERPTNAHQESPDSYTTPALLQYDGQTEIVVSGGDAVTGHDPATGNATPYRGSTTASR
jgi:hypothetical protein